MSGLKHARFTAYLQERLDVYIIGLATIGLIILYPGGNLAAIDAFFLGVSAGTVTGLTTLVLPFLFPAMSIKIPIQGQRQQHQAISTDGPLFRSHDWEYSVHQYDSSHCATSLVSATNQRSR